MPTYEYECDACGHEMELFQSMSDKPKRKCPSCGKLKLKRLIGTGSAILFKGSGFYETDYRSESYKKAAKAETDAKKPADSKKSDTSKGKESKPAEKAASKPKSEGSVSKPKAKRS